MSEVASSDLTNQEWAARFSTMMKWLKAWPASAEVNVSILRNWIRWLEETGGPVAGLNPDELADFEEEALQNGSKRERYLLLDKALEYIQANEGRWRLTYQRKVLSSIRGFFDTNRVSLPEDSTMWRQVLNVPHVDEAPEHFVMELETLQKILIKCNPMYRALFMSMIAGAMGPGEVLEWSGQGVKDLEGKRLVQDGRRLLRIDLPSRKGNNKAWYTVIGGDALDELEKHLKIRERARTRFEKGHPGEAYPETIFVTNQNTPLNDDTTIRTYWLRKLHQLGVIDREGGDSTTRYGYHPHQLRDVFRTLVHGKMDGAVAEFMMGHTVDPNKYDQFYQDPPYVYGEYIKALSWLNLLSSSLPYGKADASEISRLQQELRDVRSELKTYNDMVGDIETLKDQQKRFNEALKRINTIKIDEKRFIEEINKELAKFALTLTGVDIENLKDQQKRFIEEISKITLKDEQKRFIEEMNKEIAYWPQKLTELDEIRIVPEMKLKVIKVKKEDEDEEKENRK